MNRQTSSIELGLGAQVLHSTAAKVRTFLYNLAEGTTDYRSLHNLTEQVEHQYHGRFLVELIQNAHDPLPKGRAAANVRGRIAIALVAEGPFGALYVANDGAPFSESNFKSLSNLGQSDKDPDASIGHKGIGFRSVLEISDAPEVYSRSSSDSSTFDGFCFRFSPQVIHDLHGPILRLVEGHDEASLPFGAMSLVDWDTKAIDKLRQSVDERARRDGVSAEQWLRQEMRYLSPYTLPVPAESDVARTGLVQLDSDGYATVIRLPLKSEAARALVTEKIEAVAADDLLFLDKLTSVVLDSGQRKRVLHRQRLLPPESAHSSIEVLVGDGTETGSCRYRLWQRLLQVKDASEDVREAIGQLPGKWPLLRTATIAVAVPVLENPERGRLSIFLPTPLESGCSAHIHAPFFGDMSRTHIDFGAENEEGSSPGAIYNRFLMAQAADLTISVISKELAGCSLAEACAIVDLLAPHARSTEASERWKRVVDEAAQAHGIDVSNAAWCFSDQGWRPLTATSLAPTLEGAKIFKLEMLRKHSAFPIHVAGLSSRRQRIEELSEAYGIGAFASREDIAATIENVAAALHKDSSADWNAFWREASSLLEGDCRPLAGRRVLLGNDDELHASGGPCVVFFSPRQGVSEDEEVGNESEVREIPENLKPYVAFLSDRVQVYEEVNGRLQQTDIRRLLLNSQLVARFRREDILKDVLQARTPASTVALDGPESALCRDILRWGLQLTAHLADRGQGDRLLALLKGLRGPCRGGWLPLGMTSFGPGWIDTHGGATDQYLNQVDTAETRLVRSRLLVPPNHEAWGGTGAIHRALLSHVGVFDGLRLLDVPQGPWSYGFEGVKGYFSLPEVAPPGMAPQEWSEYCDAVRDEAMPSYNRGTYAIDGLYVLPGLDRYDDFDEATRQAFLEVVIASAGHWPLGWANITVRRIVGNADTFRLGSPVAWQLRRCPWLRFGIGEESDWCRPTECWHVPASAMSGNRGWQFAHLRPLPSPIANQLDTVPDLAQALRQLGMPRFDLETRSRDSRLIEALADAVAVDNVRNWDILLSQVRGAWGAFEPSSPTDMPTRVLVYAHGGRLTVREPGADKPVYLPDSKRGFVAELRRLNLPVVAIEPIDAGRLADYFDQKYPEGVIRASDLRVVPLVDGKKWAEPANERLQDNETFEWLIPVVLTIVANFGPEAQGIGAKSLRQTVARLRDVRVSVHDAVELAVYDRDREVVAPMPVAALWHGESRTVLIRNPGGTNAADVSEALAGMVGREDLEVPIRLVLSIAGWAPAPSDIERGLGQLKLESSHLRAVREQWRGDLSLVIENLVPLISLLRPDVALGPLFECDTAEAVAAFIDRLEDPRLRGEDLTAMARTSADMFDFGCKAYERYGETLQLSAWNAVLASRDAATLQNRDARAEFATHLESAAPVLKNVIVSLLVQRPDLGEFDGLVARLKSAECPKEFEATRWTVQFRDAICQISPLLQGWGASEGVMEALKQAKTANELGERLVSQGIDVDADPSETARRNREQLGRALSELQRLGLAWALDANLPVAVDWQGRVDRYLRHLEELIKVRLLTSRWDEGAIWTLLQGLPADSGSEGFWSAVRQSTGLDDLRHRLGLSTAALEEAGARLLALQEALRRKARVVAVCGREFDNFEDNLGALYTHIVNAIPAATLGTLSGLDLNSVTELREASARPKRGTGSTPGGKKAPPRRTSKAMENLIGLSGEIHAFRMLQHRYGAGVVSASSWVSSNSATVGLNPPEATDDGRGCDFVISVEGRTYCIEVKSTQGDDESFRFGSSEIELAMKLARQPKRRRRKEEFRVLCVMNALSATPSFRLLPNPYDPKYQSQFVIEDAEARVRYRIADEGS